MPTTAPALQFSVMCLDLVEEERRPPTLQYLFYELPFPELPFKMNKFHIINCWANGNGNYTQAVKILDPSKSKVFIETGDQTFALEDPFTPQLMINVFADIVFQEQGHYWVQNFLNGRLMLEYPLTVRLVESGQGAKPAPEKVEPQKPEPASGAVKASPSIGAAPQSPFSTDEWNIPS